VTDATPNPHDRNRDRALLVRALDAQRNHILSVVDALDEQQQRTATLPSGWTPLGLIRHLTLSDERYWFHSIVGGNPLDWFPDGVLADWQVGADEPASAVIAGYRNEIAATNALLETTQLDDPPRRRDTQWDEWGIDFPSVRVIVLHVITETATHAGHLDAAVELIDGRQWIVLE
jgi:hypothetical protein